MPFVPLVAGASSGVGHMVVAWPRSALEDNVGCGGAGVILKRFRRGDVRKGQLLK